MDLETIKKDLKEYFGKRKKSFKVKSRLPAQHISIQKLGSDLIFNISIIISEKDEYEIMLSGAEFGPGSNLASVRFDSKYMIDIVLETNGKERTRNILIDGKNLSKRKELEVEEVVEAVKCVLRPNSINFIMEN